MAVDALSALRIATDRIANSRNRTRRSASESDRKPSLLPDSTDFQSRGSDRSRLEEQLKNLPGAYPKRRARRDRASAELPAAEVPPTQENSPEESSEPAAVQNQGNNFNESSSLASDLAPQESVEAPQSLSQPPTDSPSSLGPYKSAVRRERIQLEIARAAGLLKEPTTPTTSNPPSSSVGSEPTRGTSIQQQLLINGAGFQTGSRERPTSQPVENDVDQILKGVLDARGSTNGSSFQSSAQELNQQTQEYALQSLPNIKIIA